MSRSIQIPRKESYDVPSEQEVESEGERVGTAADVRGVERPLVLVVEGPLSRPPPILIPPPTKRGLESISRQTSAKDPVPRVWPWGQPVEVAEGALEVVLRALVRVVELEEDERDKACLSTLPPRGVHCAIRGESDFGSDV